MSLVGSMPRLASVAVLLAVLTACGGGVGWNGGLVGGECDTERECAERCVHGKDFPDGTCTLSCRDHRDCPGGTWCVDEEGGVCLLACRDDRDCRPGYDCHERRSEGDPGDELVCIE